jgi:hypothetical protein
VQVSVNVLFALSAPVDCEPLVALLPDHAPEAVHADAFVVDQLKVEALPLATVLGVALSWTVAAGCGVTVTIADWTALPPGPVHVST